MVGMALAPDYPLTARRRRGKGPRTKRQAARARARREADLHLDGAQPRRHRPAAFDESRTLDLGSLGRAVVRPGRLHDPRSGRPL